MSTLRFRNATLADLERCFEIETVSYAGDEAASRDKIRKRIETYPQGFLVLENEREITGFINCGCAHRVELDDEAFKELVGHDPDGAHVVIMSVVVHPDYQRRGMAGRLMRRFIDDMKTLGKTDIFLICQHELIPMYASHGFMHLGSSNSDHGGLSWHEMSLTL
jgi:ribosomal protein S18 acetylase RimI-like enzyme